MPFAMKESFIHPRAVCESSHVGSGVRIDALTFVPADVRIGKGVTINSCVSLAPGMIVEDQVYIGPNASFPASRDALASGKPTVLRRGCTINANATVFSGVTIGESAVVEAGAVVSTSVQPHAIVSGNPARVIGFADTPETHAQNPGTDGIQAQLIQSNVRGVQALHLPFINDPRGNLTVGEFERSLPFAPLRYFVTFAVPDATVRGEHAHRECHQFLICLHGSCAVMVDDGQHREEFLLDRPTFGVYVPPMVWAAEYKHSPDSTLLVFASHYYDPADYIREYHEFLEEISHSGQL